MKTFRELISWELEQDKRQAGATTSAEERAAKLGTCVLRKLRYLSSASKAAPEMKPV
jgi:hypothetical protein